MITQMRVIVYLTLASSCIALPSRKDHAEDEMTKKGRGCRCVPDEWHGVMSSVERGVDLKRGRVDALERKVLVHYSFPNRKVSMTDLLTGRRAIADYEKGFKYVVSADGYCFLLATGKSMHRMCLPGQAEYLEKRLLGGEMEAGFWLVSSSENMTTRTLINEDNCVPILEEILMSTGSFVSIINTLYLDVTETTLENNSAAFQIPLSCQPMPNNGRDVEMEKRSNAASGRHHYYFDDVDAFAGI